MLYTVHLSFPTAAYVSLCTIILVELLGLEQLSSSFGFINLFRGVATLIGAPFAGKLIPYIVNNCLEE